MLYVKAFHIIFMVTWFAGLFYLPRLFVYHLESHDEQSHQRFCTQEKKLSILMSIGAAITVILGLWLMVEYIKSGATPTGWLHAKLALAVALIGFHGWCQIQVKKFREHRATGSAKYYRLMNEIPAFALIAMVLLVVIKPF